MTQLERQEIRSLLCDAEMAVQYAQRLHTGRADPKRHERFDRLFDAAMDAIGEMFQLVPERGPR